MNYPVVVGAVALVLGCGAGDDTPQRATGGDPIRPSAPHIEFEARLYGPACEEPGPVWASVSDGFGDHQVECRVAPRQNGGFRFEASYCLTGGGCSFELPDPQLSLTGVIDGSGLGSQDSAEYFFLVTDFLFYVLIEGGTCSFDTAWTSAGLDARAGSLRTEFNCLDSTGRCSASGELALLNCRTE